MNSAFADGSPHGRRKLLSVQFLRAVAVSIVVLEHTSGIETIYLPGSTMLERFNGLFGVDLFFVISGFIIFSVTGSVAPSWVGTKRFFAKRLVRIFPVYWFYTLFMIFLILALPSLFIRVEIDISSFSYVMASLFLIPAIGYTGHVHPVLLVGWTLYYELYFYGVFGLLLAFSRTAACLFSIFVFSAGIAVRFYLSIEHPFLVVATDPLLLEFGLGMLVGFLYGRINEIPKAVSVFLLLAGLVALPWAGSTGSGFDRVLACGVPGAVALAGAVFSETGFAHFYRWFVPLGDASYSLYLSHIFTLPAAGKFWHLFALPSLLPPPVFILFAFSVSVISAMGAYRLFERPVLAFLNRILLPGLKETEPPITVKGG